MNDLTPQQVEFLRKHVKIPLVFGRAEAKRKRDAWAGEFRIFNAHLEVVRQKVGALRDDSAKARLLGDADKAQRALLAAEGQPDFAAAHAGLDAIERGVDGKKLNEKVDDAIDLYAPKVETALRQTPANAAEIELIWQFLRDRAVTGTPADAKSALAAVPRLTKALATAAAESADAGGDAGAAQEMADWERAASARDALDLQDSRFTALKARITAAFADNVPDVLSAAYSAIDTGLDPAGDGDADTLVASVATVTAAIDGLAAAADPLIAAAARYDDARGAFEAGPLAILVNHAAKDEAALSPLKAEVDAKLDAAKMAAQAHTYDVALTRITEAATEADKAIALADAITQHKELMADREERILDMEAKVKNPDVHKAVKAAYQDAKSDWATVKVAFDSGNVQNMIGMVPRLDALPEKIASTIKLNTLAIGYLFCVRKIGNYPDIADTDIARLPPAEQAPLIALNTKIRAQLADADYDKTGDMALSQTLATRANSMTALLHSKLQQAYGYKSAKEGFEQFLTKIEAYVGKPEEAAIGDLLIRMRAEKANAESSANAGDYNMARRVYENATYTDAAVKARIEGGKLYFDNKAAFEAKVVGVKALPAAQKANTEITDAETLKGAAETAAGAANWKVAGDQMKEALVRLNRAETHAKGCKQLEDLNAGAPAALAAVTATNDEEAKQVLGNMLDVLKSRSGDSSAAKDLLDDRVAEAKAALVLAKTDPEAAKAAMQQCMTMIQRSLDILAKHEPYEVYLAEVTATYGTLKAEADGGWDAGNTFNTDLTEAKAALDEAPTLIPSSAGRDYSGAMAKIKIAQDKLAFVARNKTDAGTAVKAMKRVRDIWGKVNIQWTIDNQGTRLNDLNTDYAALETLFNGRDYRGAAAGSDALVAQGETLLALVTHQGVYQDWLVNYLQPALGNLPATEVYSAALRAEITAKQKKMTAAVAAANYAAAKSLLEEIYVACKACTQYEKEGPTYKAAHDATKIKIDQMESSVDAQAPALLERLKALKNRFYEATLLADGLHFKDAQNRMEAIEADIDAAGLDVTDYTEYKAARATAEAELENLRRLGSVRDAIAPLVTRIDGKTANATKMGSDGRYKSATTLFSQIARECTAAIRAAAQHAEYDELLENLKSDAGGDSEDLQDAIRVTTLFLEDLEKHPQVFFVLDLVVPARAALKTAKARAESDADSARDQLSIVMENCKLARTELVQVAQVIDSETYARDRLTALLDKPPASTAIRAAVEAKASAMEAAMRTLRSDRAQKDAAIAAIEDALATYHDLWQANKVEEQVQLASGIIRQKLPDMENHPQRYSIAKDITAVKAALDTCKAQSDALKQDEALATIQAAQARQADALMHASIQGGGVPDKDALKEMLEGPGGSDRLDALVAGLDAKTQRKVMNEVFKARFGTDLTIFRDSQYAQKEYISHLEAHCTAIPADMQAARAANDSKKYIEWLEGNSSQTKRERAAAKAEIDAKDTETPDAYITRKLEEFKAGNPGATDPEIEQKRQQLQAQVATLNFDMGPEEKAPNLRRFYDMMSKLPNTDTLTNESLGLFTVRLGATDAPYYSSGERQVVMVGEQSDSDYIVAGLAWELGEIEDDCLPEPGEKMTRLSWNTLHEAGHAVDDKLGFMNRHGGDADMGDWINHGTDVRPIAEKIAGKYKFSTEYTMAYMVGNAAPELPAAPGGVSDVEWGLRKDNVRAHVDAILAKNNPWQSANAAKMSEIGGRCYHQAYDGGGGTWVSYAASARSKGVSGYQFRAPGEWFSELYAAYHSGKMNSSHPARAWIEAL